MAAWRVRNQSKDIKFTLGNKTDSILKAEAIKDEIASGLTFRDAFLIWS